MRLIATRVAFVAVLLASLATAVPHDDDDSMNMDMNMEMHSNASAPTPTTSAYAGSEGSMSYFAYGKHSSTIMVHIALMVLGWCFVLPAGKRKFLEEESGSN